MFTTEKVTVSFKIHNSRVHLIEDARNAPCGRCGEPPSISKIRNNNNLICLHRLVWRAKPDVRPTFVDKSYKGNSRDRPERRPVRISMCCFYTSYHTQYRNLLLQWGETDDIINWRENWNCEWNFLWKKLNQLRNAGLIKLLHPSASVAKVINSLLQQDDSHCILVGTYM